MVVLGNESNSTNSTVANQGAVDAFIINTKVYIFNLISMNIHCGEFVLLKNGDIGRLLDVDTSWDRCIFFSKCLLPLVQQYQMVLVSEHVAGSKIITINQDSIAKICFLVYVF